ncbi:MAG: FAD-dependent oxidoreductase [Parvularculaceae bacterium]
MKSCDVIIVGGGVIGLMTAFDLTRRALRVCVVDAGAPAATDASAGMLAPSFEHDLHDGSATLAQFSRASLRRWAQTAPMIEAASGESIDYDSGGVIAAAFSEDEAARLMAGGESGEWLDCAAARELEPALAPSLIGAWLSPDNGQVDPRRVRRALKIALLRAGAGFVSGQRVTAVAAKSGAVCGVDLAGGARLAAPAVVMATGARVIGGDRAIAGAVYPVKGEALSLARIDGQPRRVVRSAYAYICPKADGRIFVGATELARDWSLTTDAAHIAALKAGAAKTVPALAHAVEIDRWAGLRPATIDGAPIIGPAGEGPDGLYYALGHYRNGVLLAPETAHALAAAIIDNKPLDAAARAFSPARFLKSTSGEN